MKIHRWRGADYFDSVPWTAVRIDIRMYRTEPEYKLFSFSSVDSDGKRTGPAVTDDESEALEEISKYFAWLAEERRGRRQSALW